MNAATVGARAASEVRISRAGWVLAARAGPAIFVATSTRKAEAESSFIRAHLQRLPARVSLLSGLEHPPLTDDNLPVVPSGVARLLRAVSRRLLRLKVASAQDAAIARHLRRAGAKALLAEYGPTGAALLPACRLAGVPLIVHFHGYDASIKHVIDHYAGYADVFAGSAAVVAVSRDMEARLLALGARRDTLHYNPYGVDTSLFAGADPAGAPPILVSVGRFVEKKAPELTLLAFMRARQHAPEARLVMIGDGPLLGPCQRICQALELQDAVSFRGAQEPAAVAAALAGARALVHHALTARDGDREGLPVVVLEASSAGLPVISTRHGGIPDVVVEGETGLLVDEGDVDGMADHMVRLARDAGLAGRMGHAGRQRILEGFSMERSISGLWAIIRDVGLP